MVISIDSSPGIEQTHLVALFEVASLSRKNMDVQMRYRLSSFWAVLNGYIGACTPSDSLQRRSDDLNGSKEGCYRLGRQRC